MRLSEATYFPDAKELTRHGFVSHMEDFIGKLIGDNPMSADVDDYLKGFDIDAPKAIEMLTEPEIEGFPESAVIMRTERIKSGGTDEFGKPMKDDFLVIYKVPKRDPEKGIKGIDEKLRNLYIRKYENHIVEGTILNEDGEGGMCGDGGAMEDMGGATNDNASNGQYSAVAFPVQRRTFFNAGEKKKTNESKKMKRPIGRLTMFITEEQMEQLAQLIKEDGEFGGGALTTSNVGVDGPNDWQYDVPFGAKSKNDPAMDHKNILSRKSKANQPTGHDGRSVKESKSVKRLNESWSISDKDLRNIERIPDENWEYFSYYAYCGYWDGYNEPVFISGYVYDPHRILTRHYLGVNDKIGMVGRTRSTNEVYIRDVTIKSRWDSLDYNNPPLPPTKWPKIKVGKMWGEKRLEILGKLWNGEEMFCRFQWDRDDYGDVNESKSGIHIDPENKGKFTATKKRTGKSTSELLHSPNKKTRARANFARMAKRGWKPLGEKE